MVSRFGDKYKKFGYTSVVAVAVLTTDDVDDPEDVILDLENHMHRKFDSHEKFDKEVANRQAGARVMRSQSEYHFILYVSFKKAE